MPRKLTLRSAIAALTMAVASLCGGGKAIAEQQKGTLTVVESRSGAALRPDARKRVGKFLLKWLRASGHDEAVVRESGEAAFALWTGGPIATPLPANAGTLGFHAIDSDFDATDPAAGDPPEGYRVLSERDGQRRFAIKAEPLLDHSDLSDIAVGTESYSDQPVITFRFTSSAAVLFGDFTKRSIGEPFAIVVDDEILSAPVIREPILGGNGQISGAFSVREAEALVLSLSAPPEIGDFVVTTTCIAARPRAPPSWAPKWIAADPVCD